MARRDSRYMKESLTIFGAGVVGAGLALLFAPNSGRKTRKEISRFARSVGTRTDKAVHEFADDFSTFADTMGRKATGLLHDGRKMTRKSKDRLVSAFDSGRKQLERQRHKLERLLS